MFPLPPSRYDNSLNRERDYLLDQALPLVLAALPSPAPTGPIAAMLARWLNTEAQADIAKRLLARAPHELHATHTGPTFTRYGRACRGWMWHATPQATPIPDMTPGEPLHAPRAEPDKVECLSCGKPELAVVAVHTAGLCRVCDRLARSTAPEDAESA